MKNTKTARMLSVLSLSALVMSMTVGTASAADEPSGVGTVTGGDVSSPAAEFANAPDSNAKVALTNLWQQALEGKVSMATYQKSATKYLAARGLTAAPGSVEAQAPAQSSDSSSMAALAAADRTLSLTHFPQEKGFYCGPATGKMLVKTTNGATPSAYNGANFTQTSFAGPAHMNTEAAGSTPWAGGKFPLGVNRWRGQNWYVQVDAPSASLMTSVLTQSIGNNGMPVAADTVEFAGGAHYNGHPVNQTIGHWIMAYGYTGSGSSVKFADPSTSVWGGVSPTFSATTSTFTNNYLQSNGIAY